MSCAMWCHVDEGRGVCVAIRGQSVALLTAHAALPPGHLLSTPQGIDRLC